MLVAAPLSKFDQLRLSCTEMQFTNPMETVLIARLRPSSSLKRLEVDDVDVGDGTGIVMTAIMKALETNTTLEHLYLATICDVLATYQALLCEIPKAAGLKCLECIGFELNEFDKDELRRSLKQSSGSSILEFQCDDFDDSELKDDEEV
jgi:hypothetical protein